jgi:hypothetical protein
MMRRIEIVRVIAILVLLLPVPLPYLNTGAKDLTPLYVDETGWEIRKAISGVEITRKYEEAISQLGPLGDKLAELCPQHTVYISKKGAGFYYGFSLVIPSNMTTYWAPNSEVVLTYTHKKDTLRITSTECFFATRKRPNKLIFLWEVQSEFMVPNPASPLYSEQVPVLFARFPFKRSPDKILSCTVANVRSKVREVSKR